MDAYQFLVLLRKQKLFRLAREQKSLQNHIPCLPIQKSNIIRKLRHMPPHTKRITILEINFAEIEVENID